MTRREIIKLALKSPIAAVRRFARTINPPNPAAGVNLKSVAPLPRPKPLTTTKVKAPGLGMPKLPKLNLPDPTKTPGGTVLPGKNILT